MCVPPHLLVWVHCDRCPRTGTTCRSSPATHKVALHTPRPPLPVSSGLGTRNAPGIANPMQPHLAPCDCCPTLSSLRYAARSPIEGAHSCAASHAGRARATTPSEAVCQRRLVGGAHPCAHMRCWHPPPPASSLDRNWVALLSSPHSLDPWGFRLSPKEQGGRRTPYDRVMRRHNEQAESLSSHQLSKQPST